MATIAMDVDLSITLHSPEKVWFEMHREKDACDVLVQMDDGMVYTATFVTMAYFRRQMDLNYQVTKQIEDTPAVRYAVIDTPHIIVEELITDTIEDTIDNLLALDVFESHFTRVTETEAERTARTSTQKEGKRATQEHTAVVIAEVLVVQD
jgi:hypothetical protein